MKGIIGLTGILAIIGALILVSFGVSFFSGGQTSASLFGWGNEPLLRGIDAFFTSIYNLIVVISSWVTIAILLVVLVGVQGVFLYFYYRIIKFAYQFRPLFEKFINEISGI